MAAPNSKETLIEYCFKRLGAPVIEINVDYSQAEDRLDDALDLFSERHFDGVEKAFFKHQVTAADKAQEYISTDDIGPISGVTGDGPSGTDITSITRIFQFGQFSNSGMFDIRYQLALSDYFGINRGLNASVGQGLSTYDSTKRYINLIEDFFQPEKRIRFNKVSNKIHLDYSQEDMSVDDYLILETYVKIPSTAFSEIFNDVWLKKYATALIKKQWGANLSKFNGVAMLGGVTMNGETIYSQAIEEQQRLEDQIQLAFELPVSYMVG